FFRRGLRERGPPFLEDFVVFALSRQANDDQQVRRLGTHDRGRRENPQNQNHQRQTFNHASRQYLRRPHSLQTSATRESSSTGICHKSRASPAVTPRPEYLRSSGSDITWSAL